MEIPINANMWFWPQYLVLSLHAINVVLVAFMHGSPRTQRNYSFPESLIYSIFGLFVLAYGGFFS